MEYLLNPGEKVLPQGKGNPLSGVHMTIYESFHWQTQLLVEHMNRVKEEGLKLESGFPLKDATMKKIIITMLATGLLLLSQASISSAAAISTSRIWGESISMTNSAASDGLLLWVNTSSVRDGVAISDYQSLAKASDWKAYTDSETFLFFRGDEVARGDGSWYLEFGGLSNPRQYSGLKVEYALLLDGALQDSGTYYREKFGWIETDDFTRTAEFEAAVPIPAAAWLFGSGLLGLVGFRTARSRP